MGKQRRLLETPGAENQFHVPGSTGPWAQLKPVLIPFPQPALPTDTAGDRLPGRAGVSILLETWAHLSCSSTAGAPRALSWLWNPEPAILGIKGMPDQAFGAVQAKARWGGGMSLLGLLPEETSLGFILLLFLTHPVGQIYPPLAVPDQPPTLQLNGNLSTELRSQLFFFFSLSSEPGPVLPSKGSSKVVLP